METILSLTWKPHPCDDSCLQKNIFFLTGPLYSLIKHAQVFLILKKQKQKP